MKLLVTKQVVLRIAAVIAMAELMIMLVVGAVPHELNPYLLALLDVILLVVLSTPLIYLWVVKPFVNARDEALAQISHLAHVDPLTQLANRRLMAKHLEKAVAGIARHQVYGALMLLDLDGFKPVNDAYGHDAGDALLVEIAKRLQASARAEDVIGRVGGDEFVLLLNNLDSDEQKTCDKLMRIAEKLIRTVNQPLVFKGQSLQVGASIGIRLLGLEVMNMETAIREADIAMYSAKKSGKGRAVIFEK